MVCYILSLTSGLTPVSEWERKQGNVTKRNLNKTYSSYEEFLTGYETVWIQYWCLTTYLHETIGWRLEITILFFTVILPGPLSQQFAPKLFTARRSEETICCLRFVLIVVAPTQKGSSLEGL